MKDKKFKFKMVKMEKYVIMQIDDFDTSFRYDMWKSSVDMNGIRWEYKFHMSPNTVNVSNYIGISRFGRSRKVSIYFSKLSNRIIKVKFRDNDERDSFYDSFLHVINSKFSK